MARQFVAWDIETCPVPYDQLSESHRERHKQEYEFLTRRDSDSPTDELKSKASGTHPLLGWICCISLVGGTPQKIGSTRSWSTGTQDGEAEVLRSFWEFVGELKTVQWVTFNGKTFDVPFVTGRSLKHGIAPTRKDILNDYPYSDQPHADLSNLLGRTHYSLVDLCDHLGVESPKSSFDGSDVAPAVADGRIDEVQAYCERDVLATLKCAQHAAAWL